MYYYFTFETANSSLYRGLPMSEHPQESVYRKMQKHVHDDRYNDRKCESKPFGR